MMAIRNIRVDGDPILRKKSREVTDFNEKLCWRWEHEINQIAYPWQYDRLPTVKVLQPEELKGKTTVEISNLVYEKMIADLGENFRFVPA